VAAARLRGSERERDEVVAKMNRLLAEIGYSVVFKTERNDASIWHPNLGRLRQSQEAGET
jgi:hypothetical protein